MQDKIHRLLLILHTLPRAPRGKINTAEIQSHLSAAGHNVTLRTVQRDLENLSHTFSITSDNSKPAGWFWSKDAVAMGVPSLDAHSALVLQFAQKHLERLLPAATLEHLNPQFRQAAETLEKYGNGLRKWQEKVRVLPRGPMMHTPTVNPVAQAVIYDALLKEKRVKVNYRPGLDEIKEYEVNPLGLIARDHVIYLICSKCEGNAIRQFLLHRVISAEMLDTPSQYPEGFNLDSYIQQGEMSFSTGKTIQLCFALNKVAARQVGDCPLSADQHVTEPEKGSDDVIIEATVQDTMELRWWLLSFGEETEILEPPELREWFKEVANNIASYYADDNETQQ